MQTAGQRFLTGWIALLLVLATAGVAVRAGGASTSVAMTTSAPAGLPTSGPPTSLGPITTTTTAPPPPPTTVPPPTTTPTTAAPRPRTPAPRPSSSAPPTAVAGTSVAQHPAAAATPQYALSLLQGAVPARWLAAIPVSFQIIDGLTSWSNFSGLIEVGAGQLTSAVPHARFVLTHEFGHLIAFHYGTDAYDGAPPAGFPYGGQLPEEMWADCVAQSFTGTSYPTSPLPSCPSDALAFTTQFLASGPGAPLR